MDCYQAELSYDWMDNNLYTLLRAKNVPEPGTDRCTADEFYQ